MIICDETCKLYPRCRDRRKYFHCVYEFGIRVEEEEDDEFLEKLTY